MNEFEKYHLKRLREIVRRHGLAELAREHAEFLGRDENDPFSFAPCVCAAAQEKFMRETAGGNSPANAICAEVWSDESFRRAGHFREKRDEYFDNLRELNFGAFRIKKVENPYDENLFKTVVIFRCRRCGAQIRKSGAAAGCAMRWTCPDCGVRE